MVYTQKNPALLLMSLLMLAIGFLFQEPSVTVQSVISYLDIDKQLGEIQTLPWYFGWFGLVAGLWQLVGRHKIGHLDYYLATVPGAYLILTIAMLLVWFVDPWIAAVSKSFGPVMGDKYLHDVLGLNYVVLGILCGILIVNVFGIPRWAQHGVRLSRLGLKTGVILLGSLYSLGELESLGKLSVLLIAVFVLGSVGLVLLIASRRNLPNSLTGVLSAGMGVCGVSATVACAPVVQAKSLEIAYTIGTVLLWGVGCMFIFPIIGNLLNMSPLQFGAWAGTGILNSAQVAGAALSYQPDGIETLKVAEIFNITRVLFLPIIVLWLAVWFVKREEGAQKIALGKVIVGKFPIFVLGFLLLFALSSTGIFAPAKHYQGKYFDNAIPEEKLLSAEQVTLLGAESAKVQKPQQIASLAALMQNRKLMSEDDDDTLRGLVNSKVLSADANVVLKAAHKAVRHTAKKVDMFRKIITWLFAFGLTGLGMQITIASIMQAGGEPLVIGGIVGTLKAVLSLIVVMLFVSGSVV